MNKILDICGKSNIMEPIRSFEQLTSHLQSLNKKPRIAVVCAKDANTEYAISRALGEGIAEFIMLGDATDLESFTSLRRYPHSVQILHIVDPDEAAREAVRMVRDGEADILMKGIINTDNLLHEYTRFIYINTIIFLYTLILLKFKELI